MKSKNCYKWRTFCIWRYEDGARTIFICQRSGEDGLFLSTVLVDGEEPVMEPDGERIKRRMSLMLTMNVEAMFMFPSACDYILYISVVLFLWGSEVLFPMLMVFSPDLIYLSPFHMLVTWNDNS